MSRFHFYHRLENTVHEGHEEPRKKLGVPSCSSWTFSYLVVNTIHDDSVFPVANLKLSKYPARLFGGGLTVRETVLS